MDIYEQASIGFRWLNVTEKFDSKESYFVANEIGIRDGTNFRSAFSPIEEAILNRFSETANIIQSTTFIL